MGELELQLRSGVGLLEGPSPDYAQARYHADFLASSRRSRLGLGIRMSSRALVLAAVGLTAIGGSVAAAAAAWTGSPNPVVWGRSISQAVATCSNPGASNGLGSCVSEIVKEKGAETSAGPIPPTDHGVAVGTGRPGPHVQSPGAASGAGPSSAPTQGHGNGNGNSGGETPGAGKGNPGNGNGNGHGNGNGNGSGNGNGHGQPSPGPPANPPPPGPPSGRGKGKG